MPPITIRKATRKDSKPLLDLIDALADYEKLKRPTTSARRRLIEDAFSRRRRYDAILAFVGDRPVGYAIILEIYSSFLALPTLFLEDIFIVPELRRRRIGFRLFQFCVNEAKKRGCGRLEWMVLDWNSPAIGFYKKIGARHLKEWLPFRLEQAQFGSVIRAKRS